MQKKIIALAVAGLMSGAAFAQSNVTVYGVADATFDNVKAGGASTLAVGGLDYFNTTTGLWTTTPAATPATTYSNLNQPNRNRVSTNSSLLGFKGSEALGNGLTAVFQLEGGASFDSAGAFAFNRDSFVGLAGGFGTVAAGNLTGPTRGLGAAMDPFAGATGITSNTALIGKLGGATLVGANPYFYLSGAGAPTAAANSLANVQAAMVAAGYPAGCAASGTCTSIFDTRWTNAIAYISPNFAGLTLTAAYVANENKSRSDVVQALNTRGYDIGARYENGPILAGLTYNKAKFGDVETRSSVSGDVITCGDSEASDLRAAFRYNFGMATVGLMYDRVKASDNSGSLKRNAWFLPVTFNVSGNGKIVAQYGQAGDISGTSQTGAKMFALGYEHSLSKRTVVKAVWSQINNDQAAYYDFGVNSVGGVMPGADPKGFQVGVRHSF